MVLQKQLIQIPYGGLQTKVDPKVAPLGTYSVIDNMIMNRYPELVKRDGLNLIGTSTVPQNINASYSYLNEVGVITNNSLYSYSPSIDEFQLKGLTASPIISSNPVISNTYTQVNCDAAMTIHNISGVVWEDSRGGVRCTIQDYVSDTFLVSDYSLSVTGTKPKAVAVKDTIYFFWVEPASNALKVKSYNTVTTVTSSTQTVTSSLATCQTYDVLPCFSNILVTVVESTAAPDAIKAYYWDVTHQQVGNSNNGIPSPLSLGFANSGTLPPALSLAVDPTGAYFTCTIYNDTNEVWTRTFYAFLQPVTAETRVATATTDAGWAISSCLDTNHNLYIFYASFNTLQNSFQALVSNVYTTPSVTYNRPFYLQLGVVSRAFYYSGNAYVILGYDSALQNTYFGVRDDGACFGRLFAQQAGGNINKANCVAGFNALPAQSDTFVIPLLKTTKIVSSANSYNSTTSVFTEQIFFSPKSIDNKVIGRLLNIAGGYLKQYDGSSTVFEQGFHIYPEKPTLVQSASTGTIANGSYSYVVMWEWYDNQGQIHRSEPSIPTTITTTGTNNTVTVTVRALPITNKETRFGNTRTPVVMAVYRTLTLGTTYYRLNQLTTSFVYNDSTTHTLTFTDTLPDTSIQSNSQLYTTGGVFQNIALPAVNLMTVGKNTVLAAGTDTEPNMVFYSKQKEEGVGVEFSNEMSFIVDSLGGNITAIAAMDDKFIIFKKSLVYYIAGALPDKLGNGSTPIPLLVASDCGCSSPQSVVLTGMGIMFESQKGIYLIDRQLNVSYIGQDIDLITTKNPSFKISSAVNLPDQNQVYFTDLSGRILNYDTYFKQWFTQTLPFIPVSATLLGSTLYVSDTSDVYQTVPNRASDGQKSIISRIKTNWISLANLEGFARIYNILILGDNAELSHRLKVNLYYDFEDFPRQTLSIIPQSLLGSGYGVESPYGGNPIGGVAAPYGTDGDVYGAVGTTYGGPPFGGVGTPFGGYFDGTYQFVIRPMVQKCTSIMIEIFDEFPGGNYSQSFKFSGISIVAGLKNGLNRNLSYTKRLT